MTTKNKRDRHDSHLATSGQETERVNSYNPRARMGQFEQEKRWMSRK